MPPQIAWQPHALVSVLHAVEAISRKQPLADVRLSAALESPAQQFAAASRGANLSLSRFWGHLIPSAAKIAGSRLLIETAVTKTMGRGLGWEGTVTNLAGCLAAVDAAGKLALPNLEAELALRQLPLREQWEARGP